MSNKGDKSYLAPYREVVEKIGPRFEALLWTHEDTQTRRFAAFADMVDLTGRVIADAGCGRADLLIWMHNVGIAYGAYIGIEAIDELLAVSRDRGSDRSSFVKGDFVADDDLFGSLSPKPDVIYFSGSLNTLDESQVARALENAWNSCGEVLCFNFLSDRNHAAGGSDLGPARRFDTLAMLDWALQRSPLVQMRQDYLGGNDATVVVFKEATTRRSDSATTG